MSKYCPYCGTLAKEDSKFCESCGGALTPPTVGVNKGKSKIWIPITAVIAVLVVVVGALWIFTDVLPWTDKGGKPGDLSILSPEYNETNNNATGAKEDTNNAEKPDNSVSASALPLPSITPSPGTSSPLPMPSINPAGKEPAATGNHDYSVDYLIAGTPRYVLYVEEDGIYRMEWDGSNRQILFDNPTTAYFLDIYNEELYFVVNNYTYYEAPFFVITDLYPVSVYAMDIESGSIRTVLDSIYNLSYYLGTIYYTPDYIEIWKMDLNPGSRAISILDFSIDWSYCSFELDIVNSSLLVTACDWDLIGDEPDIDLSIRRAHYSFDGDYIEDILPHRKGPDTVYWDILESRDIFRVDAKDADSFLYNIYLESGFDGNQLISDSSQDRFYLFENYIYYWAYKTGYFSLRRADHNGRNDVELPLDTLLVSTPLYYHNGYIYLLDDYMSSVVRINMDGSDIVTVYEIQRDIYEDDLQLCFADDWMGIFDKSYVSSGFQGFVAVVDLTSVG